MAEVVLEIMMEVETGWGATTQEMVVRF